MFQTGKYPVSLVDRLQSLKQFFINVAYHKLVASPTKLALFTEPPELDWLQVYDTEPSELDWLQVYDTEPSELDWLQVYDTEPSEFDWLQVYDTELSELDWLHVYHMTH